MRVAAIVRRTGRCRRTAELGIQPVLHPSDDVTGMRRIQCPPDLLVGGSTVGPAESYGVADSELVPSELLRQQTEIAEPLRPR